MLPFVPSYHLPHLSSSPASRQDFPLRYPYTLEENLPNPILAGMASYITVPNQPGWRMSGERMIRHVEFQCAQSYVATGHNLLPEVSDNNVFPFQSFMYVGGWEE